MGAAESAVPAFTIAESVVRPLSDTGHGYAHVLRSTFDESSCASVPYKHASAMTGSPGVALSAHSSPIALAPGSVDDVVPFPSHSRSVTYVMVL